MQLPYVYRVTKYNPADRDEHGRYTGSEDVFSDHGEVEASYLQAVAAFARDTGVDHLAVREPEIPSFAHFGVEPPVDAFGLNGLFPVGPTGFHDGAEVPLEIVLELVRAMLRDNGAWCRLEAEGTFAVHVGWDQYVFIGSSRPCEEALARTRALGLFPERLDASPYDMETDGQNVQRPDDDDFWAGLHWAVGAGRAGLLEEMHLQNASRWHRLTRDTIDTVRPGKNPTRAGQGLGHRPRERALWEVYVVKATPTPSARAPTAHPTPAARPANRPSTPPQTPAEAKSGTVCRTHLRAAVSPDRTPGEQPHWRPPRGQPVLPSAPA